MRAKWRARSGAVILREAMPSSERFTEGSRASVLAVDDHARFLEVLREVVLATGHLEVVGEARTGEGAITAARTLEPDMVLMDIQMPGIGGLEAAEEIKASRPSTVIVLITSTHPDELPPPTGESCVDAVMWKSVLRPHLLDEIWLRSQQPD
jgi:DNA-binding NarL/FixJ family response regulator